MRKETRKHDCSQVTIERAANGFIVSPSYPGIYNDKPLDKIARNVEEACKFAADFLSQPYVTQEDVY